MRKSDGGLGIPCIDSWYASTFSMTAALLAHNHAKMKVENMMIVVVSRVLRGELPSIGDLGTSVVDFI